MGQTVFVIEFATVDIELLVKAGAPQEAITSAISSGGTAHAMLTTSTSQSSNTGDCF